MLRQVICSNSHVYGAAMRNYQYRVLCSCATLKHDKNEVRRLMSLIQNPTITLLILPITGFALRLKNGEVSPNKSLLVDFTHIQYAFTTQNSQISVGASLRLAFQKEKIRKTQGLSAMYKRATPNYISLSVMPIHS